MTTRAKFHINYNNKRNNNKRADKRVNLGD